MKRTAEMVLGVIGISIDALLWIGGVIIKVVVFSGLTEGTGWYFFDALGNLIFAISQLLWIPIISCLVSFVLGLVALLTLKKHTNVAGACFIAAAVISSWLLFAFGAFQSLLYLAAGLMCFLRKNKNHLPVEESINT